MPYKSKKQGRQKTDRKSDSCVVSKKWRNNGRGEKATTLRGLCKGNNCCTQRWKTIGNETCKDSTDCKGNAAYLRCKALNEEPYAGNPQVRFREGSVFNPVMGQILWHSQRKRRETEKTNLPLKLERYTSTRRKTDYLVFYAYTVSKIISSFEEVKKIVGWEEEKIKRFEQDIRKSIGIEDEYGITLLLLYLL